MLSCRAAKHPMPQPYETGVVAVKRLVVDAEGSRASERAGRPSREQPLRCAAALPRHARADAAEPRQRTSMAVRRRGSAPMSGSPPCGRVSGFLEPLRRRRSSMEDSQTPTSKTSSNLSRRGDHVKPVIAPGLGLDGPTGAASSARWPALSSRLSGTQKANSASPRSDSGSTSSWTAPSRDTQEATTSVRAHPGPTRCSPTRGGGATESSTTIATVIAV